MARVTPICTAEKNRFGSSASRAAFWPRLPRLVSALTWPSRSETRAISEPEKNPPMHTMTRTTMMSRTTLLIFSLPLASGALLGAAFPRRSFVAPRSGRHRAPLARGSPAACLGAMCLASLERITYELR